MDHTTLSTPTPEPSDIATIGSGAAGSDLPIFLWAQKTGNAKVLRLLFDTAGIFNEKNEERFGICLHFLAKPSISNLLGIWAEHDTDAARLRNLANDLRAAPKILKLHRTVPASKRLVDQFRGEVSKLQVLLMLAVRRPANDQDTQNWFDALRLWILIQGIRRTRIARYQDGLVDLISEKLRLAADGDSDWLNLVRKIRGRIDSVESVSVEVRAPVRATKQSELTDTHREFLSTLARVARGDAKPIVEDRPQSILPGGEDEEPEQSNITNQPLFDQYQLSSIGEEVTDAPYRQSFGGIVAPVKENTSSGERALTGRGIQLRSAEQLQFLPWSWHTLNPIEHDMLNLKVAEVQTSTEAKKQILAWLIRVAILTSRSIRLAVDVTTNPTPSDEWQVTPDLRKLHRKPPRRNIRWTAGNKQTPWIRPLADVFELELSPIRCDPGDEQPTPKITKLNDLWVKVSPDESAESAFNSLCSSTPGLHRVMSGMASSVFAGQVYLQSEDAVLAQLVAMGPRAGLGGSSAYGSWPSSHVHTVIQNAAQIGTTPQQSGEDKNAAGSELDPLDDALRRTIEKCEETIKQLADDPNQWIEHHNAVVSYSVVALLAATGARPVNDPFESPALFDWNAARIFLADKVTNGRHGRLVPLIDSVFKLINETYCEHLQTLATRIPAAAEALAKEIALLANRKESKKLPFFFFLRELPCLSWDSVTERALEHSTYFNWPLPANLMRHRLSIRLRGQLLDAEIIDAILGHAEQGVMCHGPESTRTWANDMAVALPFLERTYRQLGFAEKLPLQRTASTHPLVIESDQFFALTKAFGAKARTEARKRYRQRVRAEAKKLIKTSVGKVPLESLKPEFWDRLSIDLLTIDGKRPHPNAAARYELLQRWQAAVSLRTPIRLKRLIVLDRSFDSVFNTRSIGCEAMLADLKAWLTTVADEQPLSKTGVRSCLALATLDLAITCQLASPQMLMDVLQKKNFRLVLLADKTYLEYHPLLAEHASAPVTRYRIPRRCAQWLDKAMDSKSELEMTQWAIPEFWLASMPALSTQKPVKLAALVRQIAQVVQQANYLQRPGLVAGYLTGTVPTSALPHASWVLQEHRVVLESPPVSEEDTDPESENLDTQDGADRSPVALFSSKVKASTDRNAEDSEAQKAARAYIDGLNDLLSGFLHQSNALENAPKGDEESGGGKKQARRELVTALSKHVKSNKQTVSSAIWALGYWVVHLTKIPRKKDTPYAISTVVRYLSALSRRFTEMGSDFNLVVADSEEITDFYDEVLEIDRDLDLRYVVERLEAFHQYMQSAFKIEDADWDELDCGTAVPHGSPGTLGLEQYVNALELLAPDPESANHEQLAGAFLLLLTFRFGLRAADSKGLKFEDFWLHERTIVCHVQSNDLRKLKRPASRRVVPLIEELSEFEWSIVHQYLEQVGLCRPDKGSFALFAINSQRQRFDMHALSARINQVLKRVCGDPNISLYKARHAFANRIAQALLGPDVGFAAPTNGATRGNFSAHVAKLLLGTTGPTRRAAWALARLMGHARPRTSFKSYVHLVPNWADSWSEPEISALDQRHQFKALAHAVTLNMMSSQAWQPIQDVPHVEYKQVTVTAAVVMSYLRLLRRGALPKAAARSIGISEELAGHIKQLLSEVEARVRSRTERTGREPMQSLLHLISYTEWQSITAYCERASENAVAGLNQLNFHQAIAMVSENRQLLMWKESHFELAGYFIRHFALNGDVRLLQTPFLHPVVAEWLTKYLPAGLSDAAASETRVDAIEEGIPPSQIKHRCAIAIKPSNQEVLGTGYGLVLLWVVFHIIAAA